MKWNKTATCRPFYMEGEKLEEIDLIRIIYDLKEGEQLIINKNGVEVFESDE